MFHQNSVQRQNTKIAKSQSGEFTYFYHYEEPLFLSQLSYVWCLVHNICQIIPEISQLPMSSRNLYGMEETRFHTYNGEGECVACGATLNLLQPHYFK